MADLREARESRLAFRVHSNVAELARQEAEKRSEPVSEVCRVALIEHLTRNMLRVAYPVRERVSG
jgi:hypothetical protein